MHLQPILSRSQDIRRRPVIELCGPAGCPETNKERVDLPMSTTVHDVEIGDKRCSDGPSVLLITFKLEGGLVING